MSRSKLCENIDFEKLNLTSTLRGWQTHPPEKLIPYKTVFSVIVRTDYKNSKETKWSVEHDVRFSPFSLFQSGWYSSDSGPVESDGEICTTKITHWLEIELPIMVQSSSLENEHEDAQQMLEDGTFVSKKELCSHGTPKGTPCWMCPPIKACTANNSIEQKHTINCVCTPNNIHLCMSMVCIRRTFFLSKKDILIKMNFETKEYHDKFGCSE